MTISIADQVRALEADNAALLARNAELEHRIVTIEGENETLLGQVDQMIHYTQETRALVEAYANGALEALRLNRRQAYTRATEKFDDKHRTAGVGHNSGGTVKDLDVKDRATEARQAAETAHYGGTAGSTPGARLSDLQTLTEFAKSGGPSLPPDEGEDELRKEHGLDPIVRPVRERSVTEELRTRPMFLTSTPRGDNDTRHGGVMS